MLSKDYILGLVEGEGCFNIGIGLYEPKSRSRPGTSFIKNPYIFQVRPSFHIAMDIKDKSVLEKVKLTIGKGNIYFSDRSNLANHCNVGHYYVNGIDNCTKVVGFFKDLQFQTTKGEDFMLWAQCVKMIQNKLHTTSKGIIEIARLRDCMNNTIQASKRSPEELGELFEKKLKERRNKWLNFIHNNYSRIDAKTKKNWKEMLQDKDLDEYSRETLKMAITGPKQAILTNSTINNL